MHMDPISQTFWSHTSFMPLSSNFLFKPSLIDTAFLTWARKGINSVGDLVNGTFFSFDYLVNLPKTIFLVICNFICPFPVPFIPLKTKYQPS